MTALHVSDHKANTIKCREWDRVPELRLGKTDKIKYVLVNPFESVTKTYIYRQKLGFLKEKSMRF